MSVGNVILGSLVGVLMTGAAVAEELGVAQGGSVSIGQVQASVYYTATPEGFRVVATLANGAETTPIRVIATLRPGQTVTLSVPGPAGTAPQEVFLTRTDDRLILNRTANIVSAETREGVQPGTE